MGRSERGEISVVGLSIVWRLAGPLFDCPVAGTALPPDLLPESMDPGLFRSGSPGASHSPGCPGWLLARLCLSLRLRDLGGDVSVVDVPIPWHLYPDHGHTLSHPR